MDRTGILSLFFTVLVLFARLGSFITSPLWLDYFRYDNSTNYTVSNTSDFVQSVRQSQPFFNVFLQTIVPTVLWGSVLIFMFLCCPRYIGAKDKTYPKMQLLTPGLAMAVSAILINYSLSGSRTPPYLQAILGNFAIPMQFMVRFMILRRRPTLRKGLCALAVLGAEFVCLIPSIFPEPEPTSQRREDGGATGAAAILWPMCLVLSMLPYTLVNTLMERSVKDSDKASARQEDRHLNMVFYLFCFEASFAAGIIALFWVDILPGFGTSTNIHIFWEKFKFNLVCSFVGAGCSPGVGILVWLCTFCNVIGVFSIAYLLRYSEGANYMMVVMTLRSPLLFLFWTLYDEQPFRWNPHGHLSTWLSIAALVIMIPAVVIYNTGAPEKVVGRSENPERTITIQNTDTAPLLQEDRSIGHVFKQNDHVVPVQNVVQVDVTVQ